MRGEIHIADVITELGRHNLLPAIVFRSARSQCDTDAQNAGNSPDVHLSPADQYDLRKAIADIVERYEMDPQIILAHPQYDALVTSAVGAHHAGQLLMWRLLLEELMASGHLQVLVATGTVAAGVDFPARTVVVTAHSRRGAEGFAALTAAEFQQMSGRAGRRGKDTVGFCLAAPAPFCDARQILRISRRSAEPLVSQYFPAPSTVLNLLRYRNVDDLQYTVSRSLAAFKDRKDAKDLEREAEEILNTLPERARAGLSASDNEEDDQHLSIGREQKKTLKRVRRLRRQAVELADRQIHFLDAAFLGLQRLGYLEGTKLSAKGYWAANLCTSIVLELAEIIEAGILNDVSAEKMTAIVASISGDEHRNYLDSKHSVLTEQEMEKLTLILNCVGATEMPGVSKERKVLPAAANTVLTWMNAEDWHQFRSLIVLQGVAEGDAARLITQTAEQLNQITRLYESHPKLALRAEEAKRRILRPPLTEPINMETA